MIQILLMQNDGLKYQEKPKNPLQEKKQYKRFTKRTKPQTTEDKIKNFILRNSKNGFYTRISTLSYKFEISQDKAWEIVGALLVDGVIESIHDEYSGEMKLCQTGKIYEILEQEQKRKRQKKRGTKKKNKK